MNKIVQQTMGSRPEFSTARRVKCRELAVFVFARRPLLNPSGVTSSVEVSKYLFTFGP
jgi:hypothetical protein